MDQENTIDVLRISNIVSTIFMFIVNIMASTGMVNNKTTGELSEKLPNLFVPSGLTFSIWSLIYFLLFLFIVYQGKSLVKRDVVNASFIGRISVLFVITNVANIAWIFAWHYELVPLSLVFMAVLLASLLTIYLRLRIGDPQIQVSRKERAFIHLPFSVYLGWITVATIANTAAVLVWAGVAPFTPLAVNLTVFVIIVATLISILMLMTKKDIPYSLVIIWALIGIVIKRLDPKYFIELTVASTAAIAAVVILVTILVTVFQRKTRNTRIMRSL
jgi:hypothetical protein